VLHIVNVEEIHALLLAVPALVDLQQRRDARFSSDVGAWLARAEQVLTANRIAASGNVAALRATLNSAALGATPAGITVRDRPTTRKVRDATAADVLRQAAEMISNAVRDDDARIAEAARLCQQMAAVARSAGLLAAPPDGVPRDAWLRGIWKAMSANGNFGAGAVRVEGLVGPHDALLLLDRTLTPEMLS